MSRVMLAGRAGAVGGLARVLTNLAPRLARQGINVHAFTFGGSVIPPSAGVRQRRGRPGGLGDESQIAAVCRSEGVEALVLIDTYERACELLPRIREAAEGQCPRFFAYMPIDGWRMDPRLLLRLGPDVTLVPYTDAARATLQCAVSSSNIDPARIPRIVTPIGHGLDPRFRPLTAAERLQERRRLFPGDKEIGSAFVILNANRNQTRKRIDITLEGFARFAREADNVRLLLHMETRRSYDVPAMVSALGIVRHVKLTTNHSSAHPSLEIGALNKVYNAADAGLNTSVAEGWGLVAFEHAATGAAQVMTGTAVARELWPQGAILLPATDAAPYSRVFLGEATRPAHVAAALASLYDQRERARVGLEATENASQSRLSWECAAARWAELLGGSD